MSSSVLNYLLNIRANSKAGYLVLIDPDRRTVTESVEFAQSAEEAGVDALLIGSSLLVSDRMDDTIKGIKEKTSIPVIIFPGASHHISCYADAILFLSLVSGRNSEFLIGEHVKAAPLIKCYGLEPIPTGYLLIDGGSQTSVGFMSGTTPIPRDKSAIAWIHALAAEYLGMKFIYLEAGSGAQCPVPDEMISAVKEQINIPIILGGGISRPEIAAAKVQSGADFIVTGNILENNNDFQFITEFVNAIHGT